MTAAEARTRAALDEMTRYYGKEPQLGCSLVAHRDLSFCAACQNTEREVAGWRLLAMAERGVPEQPSEKDRSDNEGAAP